MSQARTRAMGVVKATVRMKVLAERARQNLLSPDEEDELMLEDGVDSPLLADGAATPDSHLGATIGSTITARQASRQASGRLSQGGSRRQSGTGQAAPPVWWIKRDAIAVKNLLLGSWINVLLLTIPPALAAGYLDWGPAVIFGLNFVALIPLALVLGDVTEDLALRFGEVIGGLINATFGNVVEIILSLAALMKGLYGVVAMSLLGSILSNLLLVLGCSFLFGGINYKTQSFNAVGNRACSSLLMLSCIGVVLPTAFTQLQVQDNPLDEAWVLSISRGTAVLLLLVYVCYLVFQLNTHKDLFEGEGDSEEPMLSVTTAMVLLGIITIVVAICSEFLTGSIEAVSETTGLGQAFLGIIVLPIAGNACEHITAVVVATKNKMDLSLGVAVGSSIQIALFAIPVAVIFGWITGHDFSLSFDPFSALILTLSVIHCNFITADATSHWLLGVQLVVVYCLIALVYLYVG